MKKMKRLFVAFYRDFIKYPFYLLIHPINGFYEMQRYEKGLIRVATFYLILESTIGILQYRYTGFLFNPFNAARFNYIRQVFVTLSPYAIFIVANWAITTLMDGKGRMKDIYNVVGYALFMKVILSLINIVLSNFMTETEAFFYYGIESLGYFIMIAMTFVGMLVVHEYTLLKAVFTVGLTFVSAGVILFIGLLSFSLIQQVYVFFVTIYRELILRL